MSPYSLIDHTADLGIRVTAGSLNELFAEAVRALFSLLVRSNRHPRTEKRFIAVEGLDLEDLMVNWLREMLYLFNGKDKAVASVFVSSVETTLIRAEVELYEIDFLRDEILEDIKAVTYHQIEVGPLKHGFVARVIFDI